MASVTFEDLLEHAAKGQGQDLEQLTAEKTKLTAEIDKLEAKLNAAKSNLAIVLAKFQEPVRQAVKAASLVGVAVPGEYRIQPSRTNGKAVGGSYRWEPRPLPNSARTEDLTPRECEVSRAMWAFSKGSGGSAGRDGEGVLNASEFWALMREQTGKDSLAIGEKADLTLPNGRPIEVSRLR